jgi:thiol-disulfide isomerase/thioredoxin
MSAQRQPRPTRKERRQLARQAAARQQRSPWTRLTRWLWLLVVSLAAVFVVVLILRSQQTAQNPANRSLPTIGSVALDGTFTDLRGHTVALSALRGRPTVLWFVTTWCSSCQAGTTVMAQNIAKLKAKGVRVVELELYNNLGGSGPSMTVFGQTHAGRAFQERDWLWGVASQQLSYTYDPKGYLDIYYLLDSQGRIRYINGSPASTMDALLQAASQVT